MDHCYNVGEDCTLTVAFTHFAFSNIHLQLILFRCKHYFCEKCALNHYRKSKRCFVCGEPTAGVFNPAKGMRVAEIWFAFLIDVLLLDLIAKLEEVPEGPI